MAVIPRNTFRDVTQAEGPRPVFQTSRATPEQFGSLEAAALSKAGFLRSQTGTARAAVVEEFGRNISNIGNQMVEIAKKEKKEDDTNAAKRALIELKQGITARTLGKNGLFTFRGQTALNDVRPAVQDIDKLAVGIAERLPSDEARTLFLNSSGLHINTVVQEIGKFRINQRIEVDKDTSLATLKSAQSAAAAAPGVPENINDQYIIAGTEAANLSVLEGHSKVTATALAMQEYSKIYESAIISAVKQERLDVAQDIIAAKLPKGVVIDGNVVAKMKAMVLKIEDLEFGQDAAREAIQTHPGDERAQLAFLRKKYKGQREKTAVTHLKELQGDEARFRQRDFFRAHSTLNKAIAKGDIKSLSDAFRLLPEEMDTFTGNKGDVKTLIAQIKAVGKGESNPLVTPKVKRIEAANILSGKTPASTVMELPAVYINANYDRATANKVLNLQETYRRRLSSKSEDRAVNSFVDRMISQLSVRSEGFRAKREGEGVIEDTSNILNVEQKRVINKEMENFVSDYKLRHKEFPDSAIIKSEVAKLMMNLSAVSDPPGFLDPANQKWNESLRFIRQASSQQKANARVKFRDIPSIIKQRIQFTVGNRNGIWSEDLAERLAGAYAANDIIRYNNLIEDSKITDPAGGIIQPGLDFLFGGRPGQEG